MAKKIFTDESLATLVDETKSYVDSAVSTKANSSHTHSISNVTNLQSSLDAKVPTSRTVNGKALSSNISLTASDVGAAASSHSHSSYVNQNAFSNVVVGSTTIAADTTTDSLTIAAGTGISVAGDATNDKVTITNSGVRSIATGSSNGTISVNTNGTSANVAVKGLGSAAYTASTAYDAAGTATTKADAALASAKEYTDTKIDAIVGEGASETLDTIGEISAAIEENQDMLDALNAAIGNKVDKVSGKGLSTNDYTTTEKNKLAGIAKGANNYSLPTASSTLGGVKTTSTVTSTSGLTACPIISGVPYYKDTNTTYSLSSFGVTSTATELNYTDGVTSNIQSQLDGKLSTSGGTISGVITSTDGDIANRNVTTSGTYYYGGTNFDDGAFLGLYGKDQSNYAGQFRLKADNGESFAYLEGNPNGSLRWNGENVLTDSSNISFSDIGIIGQLPISNGGTGASTAANALKNLGLTATATELNYCDGVTSNIQTQINALKKPTVYTDKITLNSSHFEITSNHLVDMGNGMIYGRVVGKLLSNRSSTQIGYINSSHAPQNSVPASICIGTSTTTLVTADCKVNGIGSEERARQIYAKFSETVSAGTYVYVNFMYLKQ